MGLIILSRQPQHLGVPGSGNTGVPRLNLASSFFVDEAGQAGAGTTLGWRPDPGNPVSGLDHLQPRDDGTGWDVDEEGLNFLESR